MSDSLFSSVYKYAPVGLMVLDADARVLNINVFLKSMLAITSTGYQGRLFGYALHCAATSGNGRSCGNTPACGCCFLRRSIMDALTHDRAVQYATLSHTFMIDNTPVVKALRFSASAVNTKQGKCALVSLADMTREKQCERLLAHELDLEGAPDTINPQNLIGIVAGLMQKAGPENAVSVGMAALEGMDLPEARGSMTQEEALWRFVEIARQCTRSQDIIGRCDGGSFVFMFPGVGTHIAATITRRIHDTMAAVFSAYGADGISFSAGFIELRTPDLAAMTSVEIIRSAENRLNAARHRGGSLFVSRELTARLKD